MEKSFRHKNRAVCELAKYRSDNYYFLNFEASGSLWWEFVA
jgi:hypothetical protein